MDVRNKFLLNFAASYSTGGYKRLYEYARWFDANGGAWFVVHPRCAHLATEFPNNRYFVARQSRLQRLYNDCGYLATIGREIGRPELYYAYGIPLYFRFGKINWFHLSNVLPLGTRGVPVSLLLRATSRCLGIRIKAGLANADVISAESRSSLRMLGAGWSEKLFLSVNGSDDELAILQSGRVESKENTATVVGTMRYKVLEDSVRVFDMLRTTNPGLKLVIIGVPRWVPRGVRRTRDVEVRGVLPRSEVIDRLRRTRFYISTTCIENSYNAAAEGIFLADESYISDIGPHRELLQTLPYREVSVPGVRQPLLQVRRDALTGVNLKTWEAVVVEMIARFRQALRAGAPVAPTGS